MTTYPAALDGSSPSIMAKPSAWLAEAASPLPIVERYDGGTPHAGKVLAAVQVHADDVPFFCGGTVARFVESYTRCPRKKHQIRLFAILAGPGVAQV